MPKVAPSNIERATRSLDVLRLNASPMHTMEEGGRVELTKCFVKSGDPRSEGAQAVQSLSCPSEGNLNNASSRAGKRNQTAHPTCKRNARPTRDSHTVHEPRKIASNPICAQRPVQRNTDGTLAPFRIWFANCILCASRCQNNLASRQIVASSLRHVPNTCLRCTKPRPRRL